MARIQQRRGTKATVPTTGNLAGELILTTDSRNIFAGNTDGTASTLTPAIDLLTAMGTITPANDLIIIHDADGTGQKEKKITFDSFKSALNIPVDPDIKVAVASGETAGYLDDVIESSTEISKIAGSTSSKRKFTVDTIDCGTF